MGVFDWLKKAVDTPAKTEQEEEPVIQQSYEEAEKVLARYRERVSQINGLEEEIEALTDEELQARSAALMEAVRSGKKTMNASLEEAFAMVREAAFRCLGLRHYDVQLMGGMALHEGKIAEMATGEGKTLVCTLPAYLNALTGKGVHVVTVNDYLAKRDADQMGQVHRFLGLTVGLVQSESTTEDRIGAYDCDITYVTNSQLGFDYLRDNLAMTASEVVMRRPFHYCIIDEVDSVLIDEARTPLIISGKIDAPTKKYQTAKKIASFLQKGVHYNVDEKSQSVVLTEQGQLDSERSLGGRELYGVQDPWINFILNALKANELFKKDINYIVDNKEIVIIDEFTGRAMKGRRWGDGLHQAVECKEGIVVAQEAQTIASVSYQSFFSLFPKVGGMTGTAMTEAKEFASIYGLNVLPIPTALPKARKDYPDAVFKNQKGKVRAIMREIALEHTKGRPLLVGTTSIEDSEMISQLLQDVECPHEVLNAKPENVVRENEIIAQAGRKYAITIATNMAGRGTDILLGGNPTFCATDALKTILSDRLKVAHTSVIAEDLTLDDEIMQRLVAAANKLADEVPGLTMDDAISLATEASDDPEHADAVQELRDAFDAAVAGYKELLYEEREDVLKLGGLYVVGTNRHESRRIDNQLRGRSGRQGDPGASRFFLGLDDGIFNVFGGENLQKLMSAFRVDENTPIENKQVSSALDKAQTNVETYYYDMRKLLWDYDKLLATQRNSFYAKRGRVLEAGPDEMTEAVLQMCRETVEAIVQAKSKDAAAMSGLLKQFFPTITKVSPGDLSRGNPTEYIMGQVQAAWEEKQRELESVRNGFAVETARYLVLTVMDNLWKSHLRDMDYLRQVIGIRSYGSMNPLDEYEDEGFKLFTTMMQNATRNSIFSLFQYDPKQQPAQKR